MGAPSPTAVTPSLVRRTWIGLGIHWRTWWSSRCGATSTAQCSFPKRTLRIFLQLRAMNPDSQGCFPLQELRSCSATRGDSLDPPAGYENACPRFVIQPADLDHRMSVGCGMDDFSIADVHRGMGNLVRTRSEKQQIASTQVLSLDDLHSLPCRLEVGIARHVDSATAHQHLGEA